MAGHKGLVSASLAPPCLPMGLFTSLRLPFSASPYSRISYLSSSSPVPLLKYPALALKRPKGINQTLSKSLVVRFLA